MISSRRSNSGATTTDELARLALRLLPAKMILSHTVRNPYTYHTPNHRIPPPSNRLVTRRGTARRGVGVKTGFGIRRDLGRLNAPGESPDRRAPPRSPANDVATHSSPTWRAGCRLRPPGGSPSVAARRSDRSETAATPHS